MSKPAWIASRRVVASVSGGKDSAAMCLWLQEQGIEHDRVFMDTGWEHPDTYAYLRGPLSEVLGPIIELQPGKQMVELIRSKQMFPSRTKRYCTELLKLKPFKRYLASLDYEVINAIGIRAGESQARSRMPERELNPGLDCEVWRPILRWSEADVIAIHARHGLVPNPLYLRGARRVGCWPCIFSSKRDIARVAEQDPERINLIRALELELSARAQSPRAFFQGHGEGIDLVSIDAIVEWARTSRGGKQLLMFDIAEPGCVRWGMCGTEEGKTDG